MIIFLLVPLFAVIAFLSIPGMISQNPFTRRSLSNTEGLVLQREIACLATVGLLITQLLPWPHWAGMSTSGLISIILVIFLVPVLAVIIVRNQQPSGAYDVFRNLDRGSFLWSRYLVATTLYMLLYEVLMRGVFLYNLLDHFSVPVAIAINVAVYALMHLPKNKQEALLSIPTGVFLCLITIMTRSVWPAAIFHLAVALSFEILYSRQPKHGIN